MRQIFVLMICCLFLAGSSNSELVVHEEEIEPTIGDFFQFEMVGNSFPDFIGKSVDEEKYLRVEDYDGNGFRFEITGKGETAFDNETVNYIVMMMTWETEFTLYFDDLMDDGDGKEDVVVVTTIWKMESWELDDGSSLSQFNTKDIKVVNQERTNMNMTFNQHENQTMLWATTIIESETETISTSGASPDEYKVGSMWTTSETTRETGTERDRMCEDGETDDCEWEVEEIDEEETLTYTSEVLREVSVTTSAGTYETLEIKDTEEGDDPGNYTLIYVSKRGIPVKMTMYDESEVIINMQLADYHISAWESQPLEEDDSLIGDLPSLSFILSISSIALIAIVRRVRTN